MTNDVMTYFSGEICFQHPQKYQKPLHSNSLNNVKKYFSTSRPCKEIFERIMRRKICMNINYVIKNVNVIKNLKKYDVKKYF